MKKKNVAKIVCVAVFSVLFLSGCNKNKGQGGLELNSPSVYTKDALNATSALAEENAITYAAYRVKKGDMISTLAEKNGISQDTLISVNKIKNSRALQVGDYLKIPSASGVLHTVRQDGDTIKTIAAKYEVAPEKTVQLNGIALEAPLKAGVSLFVPDAELDWMTRQEINGDLFVRPLRNSFAYYSSYFGWRKSPFTGARSYHSGVDMVARGGTGTPIYAAMDGQVIAAGWDNTYGNFVKISHHSGYVTLYGHMSVITTATGKFVGTGTMIGKVGSTGLSTGPHLHFTVFKNGRTVNPLSLLR
ncbi:MAG: M23 family metallopeptidase [Treponemataceae bacterium]|nr:MAG: M23 family metallopeptidase [Treponemataceae bacterium]